MYLLLNYISSADLVILVNWQMFAASIAAPETTAMFTSTIATWINESPTNRALTDLYNATTGEFVSFRHNPEGPVR